MTSLSFFSLELLLSTVGALSVLGICLKVAWGLAQGLRIYVLSAVWKGVELSSYGPWAVVTGSTSGIGKAYAHELARRGLDVVLISRSMEKLKQVATEIEQQHGRRTKMIQIDFTHGSEIYEPIRAALQGLEIGILVNNVGMAIEAPARFLDVKDVKTIDDIVHCNMISTVKMTQIVLPQMVARKKGIVINLSSMAGWRPLPLQLLYSITKAFVHFFTEALEIEYRFKGIIVQSILPMFVETNMTVDVAKFFKVSPKSFVQQALNTVGLTNKTNGSLSHAIQKTVLDMIPEWLHSSPLAPDILLLFFPEKDANTSK